MSPVWFTDRDLGKQFPAILRASGLMVVRHGDVFKPDGKDEEWLEYCGRNDLTAITHDTRIRYRPNELDAVRRFKVRLVVVIGKVPMPELATHFVNTRERVVAALEHHHPPVILKVYRPTPAELLAASTAAGRVDVWFPKA